MLEFLSKHVIDFCFENFQIDSFVGHVSFQIRPRGTKLLRDCPEQTHEKLDPNRSEASERICHSTAASNHEETKSLPDRLIRTGFVALLAPAVVATKGTEIERLFSTIGLVN